MRAPRVAIIGTGFGGLCAAVQLEKAGFDDLFLLERAASIGGTWRDNVYPGAACDSPSFQYCFSFEQKRDWTRKWAKQPELLGYLEGVATRHGLLRRTHFGAELARARFDGGRWQLETRDGGREVADVLVSSVGQLHRPLRPRIAGLDAFDGPVFHTAEWQRGFEPRGRRIAVIGTGATAIQVVPELAKEAARLVLFQRSPSWILPKEDRVYGPLERLVYDRLPGAARAYRAYLWLAHEARYPAVRGNWLAGAVAKKLATDHLHAQVGDPALRRALLPDYPITGKRVLISDDYYPAVASPNVALVSEAAARVEGKAVVSASGERHEVDAIVLATGFEATSFLSPMELTGRGGVRLSEAWRDGAEAYLGLRVSGFPNLFLLYGPNTNLGHNSIVFMLECQVHHLVETLRAMRGRGLAWTDVRPEVQRAHVAELQAELARTTWASVKHSWYKTQSGRITNNWPESTLSYWLRTRRVDLSLYETGAGAGQGGG